MSWDSVPWFVGGGAEHSPEVARLLAYSATGGAEGIVEPTDLKVTPLDVPGGAVRTLPGSALIRNHATGGAAQTYAARLPQADEVEIAPTGSGSGRSDLIVARIEDPFMPGEPWQEPSDPAAGPYVYTRVIPDVGSGTVTVPEGMSAIPLARIDLPASTGTVTAAMITDLRRVAIPRKERHLIAYNLYGRDGDWRLVNTSDDGQSWPNINWSEWQVDIPSWATRANIVGAWHSIIISPDSGGMWGNLWVRLGWNPDQSNHIGHRDTQMGTWDLDDTVRNSIHREYWSVADDVTIPASIRGTRQPLRLRARRRDSQGNNDIAPRINYVSSVSIDIEFLEAPA